MLIYFFGAKKHHGDYFLGRKDYRAADINEQIKIMCSIEIILRENVTGKNLNKNKILLFNVVIIVV